MSIEQFEISLGSRIPQVPARQNIKAMQFQEARRAALEAAKAKLVQETSEPKKVNGAAVLEELIVHEPIVQEVINSIIEVTDTEVSEEELRAEYNAEEFTKLTPEVLPAQYNEDTGTLGTSEELERTNKDALEEPEGVTEDAIDDTETEDTTGTISVTSEDALEELDGTIDEQELYIEEMLDISEDDEDIVLVHKSTVLELDDDNFEIKEIREIKEENK